jgi:hypothetical protein
MKRFPYIFTLLSLVFLFTGCSLDDDEVRGGLVISPPTTTLGGGERTVLLSADAERIAGDPEPIVYPLEWSVADPTVGSIQAQAGNQASYEHHRTDTDANTVLVRDQLGREGLATVFYDSSL